jgi:hypothetical protein
MTGTAVKAMTAAETVEVFLVTCRVMVDGGEVFRIVNNTESVTINGELWEAFPFTFVLPGEGGGGIKSAAFEIDNIDRRIQKEVTLAAGKTVTAEFNIILASSPDIVERGPFKYVLRDFQITKQKVRAALYDFYLDDLNIPGIAYTPNNFPGLF